MESMTSIDRSIGLLLAAIVVLSTVPAAAAGPVGTQSQQVDTDSTDDDLGPADEIYVKDDGSAVLVYNDTTESSSSYGSVDQTPTNAEYGANVSSNLFYLLVTEPVEGDTDVTGQGSLLLTQENVSGDGQLSFEKPETLSNLDFELRGEATDTNAESSMDLDATFSGASGSEQLESASTSGQMTVTGTDFNADGEFQTQLSRSLGSSQSESQSYVLTEDDGSYTVEVERDTTLSAFSSADYSTRERARQTIEEEFGANANDLGGTVDVTIQSYEYTENDRQPRLDIAYTVEYNNVKSGLSEELAQDIAESEDLDLTSQEAQELADQMEELTIERAAASYQVDGSTVTADFEADIRNYDAVLLATADIAEASDSEEIDEQSLEALENLRTQVEAQKAANLEQQVTWSANVDKPSSDEVSVSAEADYTTENWGAYISEMNDRGIETYASSYEVTASTTNDNRINVQGSLSVDGDILTEISDQMMASSEDEEGEEALLALMSAEPQRGKVNFSVDNEQVRVEMGAEFNNLSALRDRLAENGSVPAGLESVVGRSDGEDFTTYMRVKNAVGSSPSEDDVRALEYVDSETTVYLPGQWDRDFPQMDTERASNYLSVENPNNTTANGTATSSGSGPGFGVVMSLLAVLGAVLALRRRR